MKDRLSAPLSCHFMIRPLPGAPPVSHPPTVPPSTIQRAVLINISHSEMAQPPGWSRDRHIAPRKGRRLPEGPAALELPRLQEERGRVAIGNEEAEHPPLLLLSPRVTVM